MDIHQQGDKDISNTTTAVTIKYYSTGNQAQFGIPAWSTQSKHRKTTKARRSLSNQQHNHNNNYNVDFNFHSTNSIQESQEKGLASKRRHYKSNNGTTWDTTNSPKFLIHETRIFKGGRVKTMTRPCHQHMQQQQDNDYAIQQQHVRQYLLHFCISATRGYWLVILKYNTF